MLRALHPQLFSLQPAPAHVLLPPHIPCTKSTARLFAAASAPAPVGRRTPPAGADQSSVPTGPHPATTDRADFLYRCQLHRDRHADDRRRAGDHRDVYPESPHGLGSPTRTPPSGSTPAGSPRRSPSTASPRTTRGGWRTARTAIGPCPGIAYLRAVADDTQPQASSVKIPVIVNVDHGLRRHPGRSGNQPDVPRRARSRLRDTGRATANSRARRR